MIRVTIGETSWMACRTRRWFFSALAASAVFMARASIRSRTLKNVRLLEFLGEIGLHGNLLWDSGR